MRTASRFEYQCRYRILIHACVYSEMGVFYRPVADQSDEFVRASEGKMAPYFGAVHDQFALKNTADLVRAVGFLYLE